MNGNINHEVFRRAKASGSYGRKLTAKDIKNMESFEKLLRTDKVHKLLKNLFLESQTAVLPCVWIGDERIVLQWHLLVVRGD